MRIIFRLCAKSTFRLALAAAAAQDMAAGFTDLALDLDDVVDEEVEDGVPLLLAFLDDATTVVVGCLLMMDVFEVFGADTCVVDDEADDVQWTGGFGNAVGAGAS